jgi:TPR repeat protein
MADQTFNLDLNFYQSANADADAVKNDFIIRLREYDIIMDDIRRNPMKGSVQHYLLLGRRGSGKSTLLKRIQTEVDTDKELSQKYIAVNPAEEQANIYRLFDLWETIKEELEHKDIAVEGPEWNDNSNIYSRSLFASIHKAIEKSGKKIILLLDNIDRIFDNLKEDAGLLRETLLNYSDIKIIGCSTRMTEHFWRYDLPFYEFFRVLKLEPLTNGEIKTLFLHWSGKFHLHVLKDFVEKRTGQLEAVRILTDGLPRTLMLFVNILVNKETGTGYEYMKLIMDRVTPLYQERLNNLPPAQRKVIIQLAFLWEGVSTSEVAKASLMDTKIVSAQLSQLADNGIVDKISTQTKHNLYRLSERFFNLWLIFTQGSPKEKRKARYLTIFLESFYDGAELKTLAEDHLQGLGDMEPDKAVLLTKAFAQSKYISTAMRDMLLNKTNRLKNLEKDLQKQLPETTKEIWREIINFINKQSWDKAIQKAKEIEQEDGNKELMIAYIYDISKDYNKAENFYLLAVKKSQNQGSGIMTVNEEEQNYGGKNVFNEEDTNAIYNLALFYHNQQKYQSAEKYYLMAIEKGDIKSTNNIATLYYEQAKFDLAEKYFLKAIDKGNFDALFSLALLYYNLGINKEKALRFISQINSLDSSPDIRTFYPVIRVWNGQIDGILDELQSIIKSGNYTLLHVALIHLLIHHQTNLIYNLFSDPEFGQELKGRFQPIYYAAAILAGKDANIALKIPPELKETVNEILKEIKEKQAFYYK